MPRIKEKYPLKNSRKESKSRTNKVEIHFYDSNNEITSSENEDSQKEDENNTIFNLTFKFDKKICPLKI